MGLPTEDLAEFNRLFSSSLSEDYNSKQKQTNKQRLAQSKMSLLVCFCLIFRQKKKKKKRKKKKKKKRRLNSAKCDVCSQTHAHAPTRPLHLAVFLARALRACSSVISSRRASAAPLGAARCLGRTMPAAMRSAWVAPPARPPSLVRRCASRREPRPRRCGYG